jgi:hypothetical protein
MSPEDRKAIREFRLADFAGKEPQPQWFLVDGLMVCIL